MVWNVVTALSLDLVKYSGPAAVNDMSPQIISACQNFVHLNKRKLRSSPVFLQTLEFWFGSKMWNLLSSYQSSLIRHLVQEWQRTINVKSEAHVIDALVRSALEELTPAAVHLLCLLKHLHNLYFKTPFKAVVIAVCLCNISYHIFVHPLDFPLGCSSLWTVSFLGKQLLSVSSGLFSW